MPDLLAVLLRATGVVFVVALALRVAWILIAPVLPALGVLAFLALIAAVLFRRSR